MKAPKQCDLLKSLDRIIEQMENKLKSTRINTSLITSIPEEKAVLSLNVNGAK